MGVQNSKHIQKKKQNFKNFQKKIKNQNLKNLKFKIGKIENSKSEKSKIKMIYKFEIQKINFKHSEDFTPIFLELSHMTMQNTSDANQ